MEGNDRGLVEALSGYLPGHTEDNHKEFQLGWHGGVGVDIRTRQDWQVTASLTDSLFFLYLLVCFCLCGDLVMGYKQLDL
jgi:hypothetical protein